MGYVPELTIAQDHRIGVFAEAHAIASFKYIQGDVAEISFLGGPDDVYFVGHIHRFEKAVLQAKCLHFVKTGEIPTGVYRINDDCCCELCRK